MNLGKNVYNLLKRQPEVYVEGLGSFRRNHTSATYDEKRNVYLPPITYIDFDRKCNQGYDFTQYIQQLQHTDSRKAVEEVASQVEDVLRRVKEDGQVKLDDLGYLVSYGEGYVFKALDLSGFQYTPVEAIAGQPQPKSDVNPEQPSPVEEQDAAMVAAAMPEELPVVEEPDPVVAVPDAEPIEEIEEEQQVARSGSNTVWYAIMAVVALGVIVWLYFVNRNQQAGHSSQIASATVDSSRNQQDTTLSPGGNAALIADSLEQTPVDTNRAQADGPLVPEHHTWQIVIGSHKTLAQAYEQAESYNKAGYSRVRVIPSNLARNRKKVIWDSYETKQEVDSALKYVQKHHIRDAWPDKIK